MDISGMTPALSALHPTTQVLPSARPVFPMPFQPNY